MKTVYFDSFFGLLNKFFYYGLRVLIIFIFSKNSSSDDFGSFVYLLNIVEICRLLIDFGIDSTYTRKLAMMNVEEGNAAAGFILSQKIITSLIGSCLIASICYFTGMIKNTQLLFATAFILPILSVNSFVNIFFQAKNNNRLLSIYYFIGFLLSLVLIYILISEVASYVVYALMEVCFFLILLYAIWKRTLLKFRWVVLKEIKRAYKTSFYNGSSQTVVTLYSKSDLFFIAKLSPAINIAYYGFFVRIMDPLMMIASALAISAYSFFSRHLESSEKSKVRRNLRQYLGVTFVYACLILVLITFALPYLLDIVGSRYNLNSSLAFFFGLATSIRIISAAQGAILLSFGKFGYTFKIALINICTLFPLYFFLVPMLGIRGVLISVVVSEIICILIKARTLKPILF